MDSYGNFTLKSADSDSAIILVDESVTDDAKVNAYASIDLTDTDPAELTAGHEFEVANGYAWFMLAKADTHTSYVKKDYLNITAAGSTFTALVQSIPIYNPTVSNSSSYTGFPVTYTAFVGQSGTFYFKIEDASEAAVQGAKVEIVSELAIGTTNILGETTITWTPTATGTYDIHLNDVLLIGTITVESYVTPQLVIEYSPDLVYEHDEVTISVTYDGNAESGVSVDIVDPEGTLAYSKMTTALGTCTFIADEVGYWTIYASKTDYTEADETINVLDREPVYTYEISLSMGWNLISLPLIPENSSIEAVLVGILDSVEVVWEYDMVTPWLAYDPEAPSNDLEEMVDGKGYWINMNAPATLTMSGNETDPFDPSSYPLVEGWNLVGFKSTYSKTVDNYLAGISYSRVYEYDVGLVEVTSTDMMIPGRGYWVATSEEGTIYP